MMFPQNRQGLTGFPDFEGIETMPSRRAQCAGLTGFPDFEGIETP